MATKKKAPTKKAAAKKSTTKKATAKKKASAKKTVMKKAAPKKKVTAKKAAAKKKVVTRKAAAKKAVKKLVVKKKAAGPTATDQVLKIIKRFRKGVDVPTLMQRTGFEEKKVRNIVTRAFSQKKIKRVSRGIYVGV
jgi:cytochrome P450